MLSDRWNSRVLLRNWINRPTAAEVATAKAIRDVMQAQRDCFSEIGRQQERSDGTDLDANFSIAVDPDSGRVVGVRKVNGSGNEGSWKQSR
ncbi:hypothetical protein VC253_01390 [Xanthomonas campestris]|uniref:hypothetical protein n=1 Tax=Xanthomonas campestris TaxID=339 RepID=UPI002B238984|nr:hypothetical protein [Xanthomonas campestris]MEA9550516.1 hypothetical protein [Xanthomonas campestris]